MSTSVSVVKNLNTLGNDHLKQDVVRDIAKIQDIVRLWSEVARAGIVLASIKLSQASCIAHVFINMVIGDLAGFGLESRKSKNRTRLLKLKVSTYVTK